jgi:hypothetical protein
LDVPLRSDDVGYAEGSRIVSLFLSAGCFMTGFFLLFAASATGFGGFVGAVLLLVGVDSHDSFLL